MRNIKARYLWIMVVALFLIAIGLIVGCSYASGTLNTILIVFLAIDFISLTIVIQAASFKTFKYKPRTKKLPTKEYLSDIDLRGLADKGFSYTEREYGYTAIKIVGRNAYKITVVEDSNLYYHPTKEENGKPNKALDKCNNHMKNLIPFSNLELEVMFNNFKEYMIIGGMPNIVNTFVTNDNYSGTLKMQKQILLDYKEDITKYANGLDHGKILNVYNKIPVFLGKDNKKFQISKVEKGARTREYIGTLEWLNNAGIVNICYCMDNLELPLKGNYNPDNYRVYFKDTGLLIGSLDEEAQDDLRQNKNFNIYKGAIYENIVADMLVKQGYDLYFYKNEKATLEMDFFVRDIDSLIPVEVKAKDGSTISLNKLIDSDNYKDIKYGIKLGYKNIGFNGKFYTFPYFLTFLLKKYLKETK